MSSLGFSIAGLESIDRIQKELNASFSKGRLVRYFREAVEKAYQKAYDLCPVDTGNMRGHLFIEGEGENWSLICNCEYASFNEYGWSGIPTVPNPPGKVLYKGGYRPFMRIGILYGERYFYRQIAKQIKKMNK
ncbi:MAG: hypothetical protein DRN81_04000 [Thermoproteota archaeon]|nr:MAG: hypothetical protein DRN81_04000 [Candidatus Korarchaeota archaeon]